MTTLTATWEIEVETAHTDFDADRDEARFRARMERLGFEPDEIATHLAVVAGDAIDGRRAVAGVGL